jgi:hypothetical protein
VQPLQARTNPLWLYSDTGYAARISKDLSVKELEKLVRRFTSLTKNADVPASCRVEPFSGAHALPAVSVSLEFFCLFFSCLSCIFILIHTLIM